MSVKEHYDTHLGNFYSWMLGDFEEKKNDFLCFCEKNNIRPFASKNALDLGAGNGIQSIALAKLGFYVKAIDFNQQLLHDLRARKEGLPVEVIHDDMRALSAYKDSNAELVICCGDTLSHLGSMLEISQLIKDSFATLLPAGKLILSFRDYSHELKDTARFIPVKSDDSRILTCFLEYFPDKVRVTDMLHEKEEGRWKQKISSYEKVRVSEDAVLNILKDTGFNIRNQVLRNGMLSIIAQKGGGSIHE